MVTYEYTQETQPNLDMIQQGIKDSEMSNKSVEYSEWTETEALLKIHFETELTSEDKTILDGIVENPPEPSPEVDTILVSENGTTYKLKVDNDGILITKEVGEDE